MKMRQGLFPRSLPLILGVECSGVIDALGSGVIGWKVGDEVMALAPCGTYAKAICLPSQLIGRKPHSLTFEQAAGLPITGLTAYRALVGTRALQRGDSLFIAGGGGGVGSMAIPLARLEPALL